jgi:hypothetical protein
MIRLTILLTIVGIFEFEQLDLYSAEKRDGISRLDFKRLPSDDDICAWLKETSPTFKEAYDTVVKRSYVRGIRFRSVPNKQTDFSEIGLFFVDGTFEVRISDGVTGAERVRTLAFEVANAFLNEEHQQIDVGAKAGFFNAREFAVAHEIYEYEAWRLYRECLLDLERHLGIGNLPAGLFFGSAQQRVADYKLPPLYEYLKHVESSQHMKHYLDWFAKHHSNR